MLTTITNIQTVADLLKDWIRRVPVDPAIKRMVLRSLTPFEAAPWMPLALEDIIAEHGSRLTIKPDSITYSGSDFVEAVDHIDAVLRDYVQRVAPAKLFTKEEAAAYLGIGIDQLNTYVSRQKVLRGMNIGRSIVFTQAELDTFNRHQRRQRGEQASKQRTRRQPAGDPSDE